MTISIQISYRGRESDSNETHKVTSTIYISYNLLLEGSEHENINITRVDPKYNAPYLILVEVVLSG